MTADTLSLSLFTLMGGGHLLVQAGAELVVSLVMFAATMDEGTDAGEPVHPAMIMLRLNTLSAAFLDIEINTADDDTPEEEPTNSTLQ